MGKILRKRIKALEIRRQSRDVTVADVKLKNRTDSIELAFRRPGSMNGRK